jgi:hypothetical protein
MTGGLFDAFRIQWAVQSFNSLPGDEQRELLDEFLKRGQTNNSDADLTFGYVKQVHPEAWDCMLQNNELWRELKVLETDFASENDPSEKRKVHREIAAIKREISELKRRVGQIITEGEQRIVEVGIATINTINHGMGSMISGIGSIRDGVASGLEDFRKGLNAGSCCPHCGCNCCNCRH